MFLIESDTAIVSAKAVRDFAGIPVIGDPYAAQGDTESSSVVVAKSAAPEPDNPFLCAST